MATIPNRIIVSALNDETGWECGGSEWAKWHAESVRWDAMYRSTLRIPVFYCFNFVSNLHSLSQVFGWNINYFLCFCASACGCGGCVCVCVRVSQLVRIRNCWLKYRIYGENEPSISDTSIVNAQQRRRLRQLLSFRELSRKLPRPRICCVIIHQLSIFRDAKS